MSGPIVRGTGHRSHTTERARALGEGNGPTSGAHAAKASDQTNLYVGGLAPTLRDDDLERRFSAFGPVVSAKVMLNIHSGESRGMGFVKFADAESASAAVRGMHKAYVSGQRLVVRHADSRADFRPPERTNRVYVRNVPFEVTTGELEQHLQQYGTVTECTLHLDTAGFKAGGQGVRTRMAFVTMGSVDAAEAAVRGMHMTQPFGGEAALMAKLAESQSARAQHHHEKLVRLQAERSQKEGGPVSAVATDAASNERQARAPRPSKPRGAKALQPQDHELPTDDPSEPTDCIAASGAVEGSGGMPTTGSSGSASSEDRAPEGALELGATPPSPSAQPTGATIDGTAGMPAALGVAPLPLATPQAVPSAAPRPGGPAFPSTPAVPTPAVYGQVPWGGGGYTPYGYPAPSGSWPASLHAVASSIPAPRAGPYGLAEYASPLATPYPAAPPGSMPPFPPLTTAPPSFPVTGPGVWPPPLMPSGMPYGGPAPPAMPPFPAAPLGSGGTPYGGGPPWSAYPAPSLAPPRPPF